MQRPHAVIDSGVGGVDQDNSGVDCNTGQRHDAIHRVKAQGLLGDEQAEGDAGKCHRYRDQDQQWLEVTAELCRQNQINESSAEQQQNQHRIQALLNVVECAGEIEVDAAKVSLDFGPLPHDVLVCGNGVWRVRAEIRFDGN